MTDSDTAIMLSSSSKSPNVAVLVDTSTGWGRRMIEGIIGYVHRHGPWHLWVEPRGRSEHLTLPPDWAGDGVIARVGTRRMAEALDRHDVPIINVSGIELGKHKYPTVTSDYLATARMAAAHFIDRGYQNFAYVGPMKHAYVKEHIKAVRVALSKAGVTTEMPLFDYKQQSVSNLGWAKQHHNLSAWIEQQPKPLAVIGWATTAASHVIDLCRDAKITIPDDVAVLASDDDALLNEMTNPPMSGVLVASQQIGYRAAERLDALMRGEKDTGETQRIPPIEIITRGSTETFAINDKEMLSAVLFLRQNAFGPLTVQEVADAVPMTRRSLERKFKEMFGRTPLAELHRIRLARAKQLLAQTDQPIAQVAEACGFGTTGYLATRFRKEMGTTPLKYRSITRGR